MTYQYEIIKLESNKQCSELIARIPGLHLFFVNVNMI